MKRICFDLDETLVTSEKSENGEMNYADAKPIEEVIEYAKRLKAEGNTIIIYTARRMGKYRGNVGSVMAEVGKITIDTIEKYEIPCDELYFGKPCADIYIDDKAHNHLSCGMPNL